MWGYNMKQIETIYQEAVKTTKNKLIEDIEKFLGEFEDIPEFEQYLEQRNTYISQIWLNVWLTKSTNDFSKRDKKAFLSEREFIVEGVDRKLINKLFRNEMRSYRPFDTRKWILSAITDYKWDELYQQARKKFLRKAEEARLLEMKDKVIDEILQNADKVLNNFQETAYLKIRHRMANELRRIFTEGQKFKDIDTDMLEERLTVIGSFNSDDYNAMADFFDELTGDIHQISSWGRFYFEYETYQDFFEKRLWIIFRVSQLKWF